ncbi:BglG family transcription antiterminator [Litchfieldia salsa]|uniref:Ascorbate-specific PTS system EIIA component n=1 Tax=Litchfieldia salsa TaxID=930152 RepID=A0A1H0W329_9BACI|nr:BglG family transcription antiterminator [Litchfieldia salsa]SDP85150.1 Transcriptional antiterminator [Litchfieldia salsa]
MIQEERPALLLNLLLEKNQTTMNGLMEQTKLSKRQITYDFEKINYWLRTQKLPPIIYKRTNLISMPPEVNHYFINHTNSTLKQSMIISDEERLYLIYLYLFIRTEQISSAHLTDLLRVSKNTVISDMKKLNSKLASSIVRVDYSRERGYHLKGSEFDKRVVVLQYVSLLLKKPYGQDLLHHLLEKSYLQDVYFYVREALEMVEKEFQLHFVEERLRDFTYFLVFYYYRQKQGKLVQLHRDEIDVLIQNGMKKPVEKLLEALKIEKIESELCYTIIQLLGLSRGNLNYQQGDLVFDLCKKLVLDFESKACITFENRTEVIETLFQHVKPAYFRMKYRIPINNPLIEQIQTEHHELYTIVKDLLLPLETLLNISIPEEEIGFITIHFGALLQKPKRKLAEKKRAVVVCPSGVSSSLMVKHQLESLFSEITIMKTLSIAEFEHEDASVYDLIFSTVPLKKSYHYFHVKPIMTPTEKNVLVNSVYGQLFQVEHHEISASQLLKIIGKYADIHDEEALKYELTELSIHKKVNAFRRNQPMLNELLTEDTIQFADQLSSWEDAIKNAAKPLLSKGVIEDSYIQAMIENVKELGPYMIIGPEVAIPHARPENGVNKVGMSFLKLKEPVYFLGEEKHAVRLLFCIAAVDHTTHLTALSQLTKLLSSKTNLETLKDSESKDEVIELITKYSLLNK